MTESSNKATNSAEEIQPVDSSDAPYDTQLLVEEIATGEAKAPKVNVADDYERSKEYAFASEAAPEPAAFAGNQGARSASSTPEVLQTESSADPLAFREMAKEINPLLGTEEPS